MNTYPERTRKETFKVRFKTLSGYLPGIIEEREILMIRDVSNKRQNSTPLDCDVKLSNRVALSARFSSSLYPCSS